jgi:hypothetical protein
MTVKTDDTYTQSSNIQSVPEIVIFLVLIGIYITITQMLVRLFKGHLLEVRSTTWNFSVATLTMYAIRHIIMFMLLYADCPKVVSLIYAILGSIITYLFVLGLADILKKGFCNDSKIITPRRLLGFQIAFTVLHFILIGPYYYITLRYAFTPNPFSIRPFQLMLHLFVLLCFIYVLWQFL